MDCAFRSLERISILEPCEQKLLLCIQNLGATAGGCRARTANAQCGLLKNRSPLCLDSIRQIRRVGLFPDFPERIKTRSRPSLVAASRRSSGQGVVTLLAGRCVRRQPPHLVVPRLERLQCLLVSGNVFQQVLPVRGSPVEVIELVL